MNILETIITGKKIEVARRKSTRKGTDLGKAPFFNRVTPSFREFLLRDDKTGIIAEFKRRSPSKGIINNTATVAEVTASYVSCGASAISVLTDEEFFGGTLEDLMDAAFNEVPLLRKDFIIDEYQLLESKAFGAGVILLIAACLTRDEVQQLAAFAKNIGLDVLLEIHNEQELTHICDDIDVVGVNNRDLKTFTVDINRSIELSDRIPAGMVKISESGIDSTASIRLLRQHGFRGFLIGERFMKAREPGAAFRMFTDELKMDT